jgi:ABC-type bacteriocin/lantibiotic exporter with double-glycine peptidase domain
MILNYFGRKTRVDECRTLLDVGRDGVTAQAITREARKFGLNVRAFSVEPADLRHVPLPAIIFWEFNHFVVLERWSPAAVEIVDPATGRRRLAPAAFDAGFTGVVLTFTPGMDFQPRGWTKRRSWLGYFAGILLNHPGLLAQILVASLLVQVLGLASPFFTQVLIDQVLPTRNLDILTLLGIGVTILTLSHGLISFVRAILLLNLQARLDARLMTGFLDHMLRLPFAFFQQRSSGDLLMRLRSNTSLRETLTGETFSMGLDSILVITYLGVLLAAAGGGADPGLWRAASGYSGGQRRLAAPAGDGYPGGGGGGT